MTIKEAVVARVTALLAERTMRPIELAKRAGLTPSTVYSFLDPNRREATINVIQKICEGLGRKAQQLSEQNEQSIVLIKAMQLVDI